MARHKRRPIKKAAQPTATPTRICCIVLPPAKVAVSIGSGRGHQDVGGGGRIQADGAAVDFDHALLTAPLAQQLQLAAGKKPHIRHFGASAPVAVHGAHPETAVAAGLRQGRALLDHAIAAPLAPVTQGLDVAEQEAGCF